VIANTAGGGYAQNVGVQVLDSRGNPIPFGTAISAGTVTAGTFNVPLDARYYQTGASVTAGQVNATATYTITYQ
jgi:type 1 fimbria pilin